MARPLATTAEEKHVLRGFLQSIGYEVMPLKSVKNVPQEIPTEVPLTVTATGGKGLESTLEASIFLRAEGFVVAPHLPARLIGGPEELDTVITRLETAGVDRIFVVAGDAEEAAGEFQDARDLLTALTERGHQLSSIGIGGYPEGHGLFDDVIVDQALRDKAPMADRILTQMCFSPEALLTWARRIQQEGVDLPIHAGMPGPVSRQKLVRIAGGLGLGQSANFLKKQQNMFWKFFSPSGYEPTTLIRGLVRSLARAESTVTGFHIFTFNDFAAIEAWRRRLLASTTE